MFKIFYISRISCISILDLSNNKLINKYDVPKKLNRGTNLHKSVKNGQLKKRASYGRIDISTIGGIFYAQRISTHTEL